MTNDNDNSCCGCIVYFVLALAIIAALTLILSDAANHDRERNKTEFVKVIIIEKQITANYHYNNEPTPVVAIEYKGKKYLATADEDTYFNAPLNTEVFVEWQPNKKRLKLAKPEKENK
jgi:hypothetical protein